MAKVIETGILGGMLFARDHASRWNKWIVVVTPEGEVASRARQHFAAVANGSPFSGRTFLAGDKGGRVSLTSAEIDVFVPDATDFSVLFLGWGGTTKEVGSMVEWRTAAAEELSLEL